MPNRRPSGSSPRRGEVWHADLDPTRGREQSGRRPVLVVSVDRFNLGMADLIVAVPITTTDRGLPVHVRIDPPESGATVPGFIMCEAVRSMSKKRLVDLRGAVSLSTMRTVEGRLRYLLGLT